MAHAGFGCSIGNLPHARKAPGDRSDRHNGARAAAHHFTGIPLGRKEHPKQIDCHNVFDLLAGGFQSRSTGVDPSRDRHALGLCRSSYERGNGGLIGEVNMHHIHRQIITAQFVGQSIHWPIGNASDHEPVGPGLSGDTTGDCCTDAVASSHHNSSSWGHLHFLMNKSASWLATQSRYIGHRCFNRHLQHVVGEGEQYVLGNQADQIHHLLGA